MAHVEEDLEDKRTLSDNGVWNMEFECRDTFSSGRLSSNTAEIGSSQNSSQEDVEKANDADETAGYESGKEDCQEDDGLQENAKCAGLQNLGNTCFLNSVLQCLTYTLPFTNKLINWQHKASCKTGGFCAVCALEDHIKDVALSRGTTISPLYLANNLSYISKSFVLGEQQDAHECFFLLIEVMQECCASGNTSNSSFISDIFMGQLRSQVKCSSCLQRSDSIEQFLGLSLEIANCNTIVEALQNFTSVEILEEDNKAVCSNCKGPARRCKQLTFDKPPQVLVVHLKRFQASELFLTKIEEKIEYDLSLDLMPFFSKESESFQDSNFRYTLYAVLVHAGWSTTSGHYFCYVKTSPGTWHCMNDSLVSKVGEKTVLQQQAYMLFYIREDLEDFTKVILPKKRDMPCRPSHLTTQPDREVTRSPTMVTSWQDAAKDDIVCTQSEPTTQKLTSGEKLGSAFGEVMRKPAGHSLIPNAEATSDKGSVCRNDAQNFSTHIQDVAFRASWTNRSGLRCSKESGGAALNVTSSDVGVSRGPKRVHDRPVRVSLNNLGDSKSLKQVHDMAGGVSLIDVDVACNDSTEFRCPKQVHSVGPGGNEVKIALVNLPAPSEALGSLLTGNHQSFMRLLKKMPSGRRNALLASALSSEQQLATRRLTSPDGKGATVNFQNNAQHNIVGQGAEVQHNKRIVTDCDDADERWIEDYNDLGRKLQRGGGGKRIIASFV